MAVAICAPNLFICLEDRIDLILSLLVYFPGNQNYPFVSKWKLRQIGRNVKVRRMINIRSIWWTSSKSVKTSLLTTTSYSLRLPADDDDDRDEVP